ncbi:hypothetical protein L21SP4_01420 [Kiritimatiella glycovorans]|uniref:PIG-L family deacetylase n=2 Tax=Kiritimatiella glycovorans TaxID=1307763 RepID=A0A0G3EGW8_9BACT|nr:hypothetical protein L21SP4_01420 [Kiritimatiella glycovorans]
MISFTKSGASFVVPDGAEQALERTTHLGVGAHQDDLEFMALHGILACYGRTDRWFGGVVCTDGAGSPESGPYAGASGDVLREMRRREQIAAAHTGQYGFIAQLGFRSDDLKDPSCGEPGRDLRELLRATRPEVVYTHNPADRHATHAAVFTALLSALRDLPEDALPEKVYGCEVWRDLDWLPEASKVVLDVSARPHLAAALNGVYDSQIAGGKRYDRAVEGRRLAQATFLESHEVDRIERATLAMDLMPLVRDRALNPRDYVAGLIDAFREETLMLLDRMKRSR